MIQISDLKELKKEDIPQLLTLVDPVLQKRKALYQRLNRNGSNSSLFYSIDNKTTKIPFEQFISAIASGYLAGEAPQYQVNDNSNEEKNKIIKELLDKDIDINDKDQMEILIDYITKFNNDGEEHYNLTTDALNFTSCYEILWEDKNNELRYKNYSPLQTVGIYDYTVDKNLIGLVRKYVIKNINQSEQTIVELIDSESTRTFSLSNDYKEIKELDPDDHNWGDVPAVAYESDFSIYETVIDLIEAFEQLIQNNRNTFEYNDSGAKLKITGYAPQNEAFIEQEVDGKLVRVPNPDRLAEDNFILQSKVFYIGEEGDINWITKDINDNATQNSIKTYMELITMMSCVPNVTDTGFTNADNNSAIKNKYFALNQKLIKLRKGFEAMYMRRWKLIFDRINLKKNKSFDFRDIKVELPVNVPTNKQEEIDNILKLKDVLSEETVITKLGYNYQTEKQKLDEEAESNFENNMENVMSYKKGENNEDNEDLPNNNNNFTDNNGNERKEQEQ